MKLNKLKFKQIIPIMLIISGILSLISDFTYGTREVAERYMFGIFLTHIATFVLTISTMIILVSLIFLAVTKLNPIVLDKIKFKDDSEKEKDNETK